MDKTKLNKEQLRMLNQSDICGINLEKYVDETFDEGQMEQVYLGLRDNLPVHLYAKSEYSWEQMREIRLGLEDDIDIYKYLDSSLSAEYMKKVRLTLSM